MIIDGIYFNLSNPILKYWYSRCKKDMGSNFLKSVIDDAINKREKQYTPKYYAYAKFIKHCTNLRFNKIQKYNYFVVSGYGYNTVIYNVHNTKCIYEIIKPNDIKSQCRNYGGCLVGHCKKCIDIPCRYYKKKNKFIIKWV